MNKERAPVTQINLVEYVNQTYDRQSFLRKAFQAPNRIYLPDDPKNGITYEGRTYRTLTVAKVDEQTYSGQLHGNPDDEIIVLADTVLMHLRESPFDSCEVAVSSFLPFDVASTRWWTGESGQGTMSYRRIPDHDPVEMERRFSHWKKRYWLCRTIMQFLREHPERCDGKRNRYRLMRWDNSRHSCWNRAQMFGQILRNIEQRKNAGIIQSENSP